MTTTTTEREAKPCWTLVYGNGAELDTGDCIPHYPTEERAGLEAPPHRLPDLGLPVPRQLDQPCFEISGCGCCEADFGDNYGGEHFESREQADKAVRDAGWEMAEDGSVRCDECIKDCDCQDDAEAASTEGESQ
jgi:hypothetical protein